MRRQNFRRRGMVGSAYSKARMRSERDRARAEINHSPARSAHRGKYKFKTRADAQAGLQHLDNKTILKFTSFAVYKCKSCSYWHIGHDIKGDLYSSDYAHRHIRKQVGLQLLWAIEERIANLQQEGEE